MGSEDDDLMLVQVIGRPLFGLGTVTVTDAVRESVPQRVVELLLDRHVCGDWGDGYIGRTSPNERFLGYGFRLDSHYHVGELDVLITTDPVTLETGKRAATTVYLYHEYWVVHGLE